MKYVVGYQSDEDGEGALDLAIWLVESRGGSLAVTAVVPDAWLLAASADQEFLNDRLANARVMLEKAKSRVSGRVTAEYLVRQAASAREGLVRAVQDTSASMLVVGSARGGPVGRIFEGSLAAELLRDPPCSVILCPKGYRLPVGGHLSRISLAFSGETASVPAVQQGLSLARDFSVPARLVSFIVRNKQMYPSGVGYDAEDIVVDSLMEDVISAQASIIAGTEDTATIGDAESWDEAVRSAGWVNSELLVVATARRGFFDRLLLGSHAGKIIHAVPVPCLLLPPA